MSRELSGDFPGPSGVSPELTGLLPERRAVSPGVTADRPKVRALSPISGRLARVIRRSPQKTGVSPEISGVSPNSSAVSPQSLGVPSEFSGVSTDRSPISPDLGGNARTLGDYPHESGGHGQIHGRFPWPVGILAGHAPEETARLGKAKREGAQLPAPPRNCGRSAACYSAASGWTTLSTGGLGSVVAAVRRLRRGRR